MAGGADLAQQRHFPPVFVLACAAVGSVLCTHTGAVPFLCLFLAAHDSASRTDALVSDRLLALRALVSAARGGHSRDTSGAGGNSEDLALLLSAGGLPKHVGDVLSLPS